MLTNAQRLAVDPSQSVWVTANAGTGKTKILIDRIVRLLLNGTEMHRIVALTFTEAAAHEMKERLLDVTRHWAKQDDNSLQDELTTLLGHAPSEATLRQAKQLFFTLVDLGHQIRISTIHSFCHTILSQFPTEAGMQVNFSIMRDEQHDQLVARSWQTLYRHMQDTPDSAESTAYQTVTRITSFAALQEVVNSIIEKHNTLTLPEKPTEQVEDIIAQIVSWDEPHEQSLRALLALWQQGSATEQQRAEKLAEFLALAPDTRHAQHTDYVEVFLNKLDRGTTVSARKNILTKKLAELQPQTHRFAREEQERLMTCWQRLNNVTTLEHTRALLVVAHFIITEYQRLQHELGLYRFDDLIDRTTTLLSQHDTLNWVMYQLDAQIEHLLVDEAQDTSPAQWELINVICSQWFAGDGQHDTNRTLFVVGDEKQSIYGFRGVDPKRFSQQQEQLSTQLDIAQQQFEQVTLDMSFRSTPPILQLVDRVFSHEAQREAITHARDQIQHQAHRQGTTGRVELWPLTPTLADAAETTNAAGWQLPTSDRALVHDPAEQLAEQIARTIRETLDTENTRSPDDFLILVRKRSDLIQHLMNALGRHHIPTTGIDRFVLQDHLAIRDLIALGRFVLLPDDDFNLACLFKSPFLNLSEDDLFALAHGRGEHSLWHNLQQSPKHQSAAEYLQHVRDVVTENGSDPAHFYRQVLTVLGGRSALLKRHGSEALQAIDSWMDTLCDPANSTHHLQVFLDKITRTPIEVKRSIDGSQNAVRIMTIHGAKGLQAPTVFLADTTQLPDRRTERLIDTKQGTIWPIRKQYHTPEISEQVDSAHQAERREYLRLLYVALTRARDELYITGTEQGDSDAPDCWYRLCEAALHAIPETTTHQNDVGELLQLTNG